LRRDHVWLCEGPRMGSVSEYQERAKQCSERAQIMTTRLDRARWLELAEGWTALSRMPSPKDSLWRNGRGEALPKIGPRSGVGLFTPRP
jgi:hypothetical protein